MVRMTNHRSGKGPPEGTAGEVKASFLKRRVKSLIIIFMIALVLSGLSAIPLKFGAAVLQRLMGEGTVFAGFWPSMAEWVSQVHEGISTTSERYPFLFYGTDWLAFAHVVIAIAFLGPLRDPIKNLWVIEWGMIACVLIIPKALVFGAIRGIPFFWRLIDCSFGVFGFLPLWLVRKDILSLQEK